MPPSSKPQYHLDLGQLPSLIPNQTSSSTGASSPIEAPTGSTTRLTQTTGGALGGLSSARMGAGSPSHEYGSRLFPRRTRELQASEGVGSWGPPTASGLSTPLRETIPESPGDDTFPDLGSASISESTSSNPSSSTRRARAGTVPSRFPPGGSNTGSSATQSQTRTSRPTPTSSPFRPGTSSVPEGNGGANSSNTSTPGSAFLSRFRAGSMPQRSSYLTSNSPFGFSVFSSNWNTSRDRSSTNASLQSDGQNSLSQSTLYKDSFADSDVKTLDYLGLVDAPSQNRSFDHSLSGDISQISMLAPSAATATGMTRIPSNRFRSYSVNAKEKYALEDEDDMQYSPYYSGTLTPSAEAAAAALAATQAQIHQHNLDVQAFANQASSSRPRARTAGLLDSPSSRVWRNFVHTPSRLDSNLTASEFGDDGSDLEGLNEAVRAMQLQGHMDSLDTVPIEDATRALWLGNIPSSTTPSSLKVIFEPFGKIESARVLTHKSCGFVNFEKIESAIRAKAQYNGKEIFPGAGPIRIGHAKVPSASGTPSGNGVYPSPSPDPFVQSSTKQAKAVSQDGAHTGISHEKSQNDSTTPVTPELRDIKHDIVQIVQEFGANEEERLRISAVVDQAIRFEDYESEIPPIPEPSQNRVHDAPKLREIRKRIDNNACTPMEIEEIAINMLPEIAELSSDYLGNTVVQKLFEHCSEPVKEAMLREISPHLAEIGIHKNGTWAAQKIIDVARTAVQMGMICDQLRPYGPAAFLDQYGNYVMQCCLRFQVPWNGFVFEIMLSRLWDIAQGRFGARAMRACLESHHASKDQQRMVAAAIALHSVQLATNANGALLLTWFLDTCTFPNRRKVLAPRLVPHLVHLCTHKVAYLTVLKLINQRNEPEARDTVLNALFFSPDDEILHEILKDQSCGATLIFKVLTTPFFDENIRSEVVQNVRKILIQLNAQPAQGYKRLLDEVGLSSRNQPTTGRDSTHNGRDGADHSSSKTSISSGAGSSNPNTTFERQISGNYFPQVSSQMQQPQVMGMQQQVGPGMPVNNQFDQYVHTPNGMNGQHFGSNLNVSSPGSLQHQNQMTYQQSPMAQSPLAQARPPGMYNYVSPVMNGYQGMVPQSMEPYRNMPPRTQHPLGMAGNGMMPQAGFGVQGGFPSMMNMGGGNPGMWQQQYGGAYMMPQQMQGQPAMGGGRRGRVSLFGAN